MLKPCLKTFMKSILEDSLLRQEKSWIGRNLLLMTPCQLPTKCFLSLIFSPSTLTKQLTIKPPKLHSYLLWIFTVPKISAKSPHLINPSHCPPTWSLVKAETMEEVEEVHLNGPMLAQPWVPEKYTWDQVLKSTTYKSNLVMVWRTCFHPSSEGKVEVTVTHGKSPRTNTSHKSSTEQVTELTHWLSSPTRETNPQDTEEQVDPTSLKHSPLITKSSACMEEMGQDWTDLVLFWAKFSTAMDKQQWSKRTLSSMIVEH